jgi:hypothetical protein
MAAVGATAGALVAAAHSGPLLLRHSCCLQDVSLVTRLAAGCIVQSLSAPRNHL